jgi:hypothetical protein
MPLFTIRRMLPGATREDLDAAGLRATVCAYEFPGLRWVRSYWDRPAGEVLCLYQAKDTAQIEEHSRRARIPCDEVREVVILGPGEVDGDAGTFVDAGAVNVRG